MYITQDLLSKYDTIRRIKNFFFIGTLFFLFLLAVIPLFFIFFHLLKKGLPAWDLNFFTQLPKPVGETGGGILNAILGSFILVGLASLVGVPWGVIIGIYLSEYKKTKLASLIRFVIDFFLSLPSIVIGIFAYAVAVRPFGGFSSYAGIFALMMIVFPFVSQTTENILKMIPSHIREAGLALGLPRWRVILFIVLRCGRTGIMTGVILAISRVSGETAPLLFTAFGNFYLNTDLSQPMASIPVQIYEYSKSPFSDWQAHAWGGACALVFFVFLTNLIIRFTFSDKMSQKRVF